jgi:hypothetical protein
MSSTDCFCDSGDWTQSLMLAKQVLDHSSHSSGPFCFFFCFLDRVSL